MIEPICGECGHFDTGTGSLCRLDGKTVGSGCTACPRFKRLRRCVVCGQPLTTAQRKYCSKACSRAPRKSARRPPRFRLPAPPKKTKNRKPELSAAYSIRDIIRIANGIAAKTGHMPSYGAVVAGIDSGRITCPEDYLKKAGSKA